MILRKIGVWLARFLDSRSRMQAVVVDGSLSALSSVISGVPQGTVLGPILFLLHIADISRGISEFTTLRSYVDDTRVQRSVDCNLTSSPSMTGLRRWKWSLTTTSLRP